MMLRNVRLLLLALVALVAALLVFGPRSIPAPKDAWWADAIHGIRVAAWINLGVLALLLIASKWWPLLAANPHTSNLTLQISNRRWFWPLLVIAVLTCLGLRLPLASKSLWWDESWVVYQVSHGKWRPDTKQPGQWKFQAHDWKRCAFYYPKPTNHVPMSLAQKASLGLWSKLTGAPREAFSELAARAPALLVSCAAVVLLGLLLRSWGWPGAGVAAAFLLAMHPWYIRYGVDGRAYALVVPLCIGGIFAISRIWQSRGASVLPWICWGVVEFLWLWAYPNGVVDVAVLNLLLAVVFLRDRAARAAGLSRLLVTSLFAAMAFTQLFLPNVMQALKWAGGENVSQPLNLDLIRSTLSQLFFGVEYDWVRTVETEGLVSSVKGYPPASFAGGMILLGASTAVLLFLRRHGRKKLAGPHWAVLATPAISGVLFVGLVSFARSYFYQRFVIAMLPSVIALLVMLFAEALADNQPTAEGGANRHTRRLPALLLLTLLLLQMTPSWFQQTRLLMTRPYAPLRDVAEFVSTASYSTGPKPVIVCYGHGHEVMPVYLREVHPALSRSELELFIAQSRAEHRPLLVIQGHSTHNRSTIPDGFTLLDDRTLFEEAKAFAGIEPEFYFRVFRLK